MNCRMWSHNWFKNHYQVDVYRYCQKRFLPIVRKYMGEVKGAVLDAGCGFGNPYLEELRISNSVGMDIDPAVKSRNKLHRKFIIGDLHHLSAEQPFEGIISVYTWEHLHDPELVLKFFLNVLSDHGRIIIIAPNRWHYVALMARFLPNYLKNMGWRIFKGSDHMLYPVYYKLCSRRTLLEKARCQGFSIEYYSSVESPPLWFAKIPPLFILACLWMSLVNKYKILENMRGTFIAVLKKA